MYIVQYDSNIVVVQNNARWRAQRGEHRRVVRDAAGVGSGRAGRPAADRPGPCPQTRRQPRDGGGRLQAAAFEGAGERIRSAWDSGRGARLAPGAGSHGGSRRNGRSRQRQSRSGAPSSAGARAKDATWRPDCCTARRTSQPLLAFAAAEFEADGIPGRAAVVVSGALDGIERILREHVRVGDRVAVEDPSFVGVVDLVSACGCIPTPVALDEHGSNPEAVEQALKQGCRAIVLTPRAQNPTGAAIDSRPGGRSPSCPAAVARRGAYRE